MTDRILIINPNSTEAVTRAIDAACEPLRIAGGPALDCMTLAEGPPGVETQQHETQDAAWLHGIVHVLEGDLDNARYWYKRAKRTFSPDAISG